MKRTLAAAALAFTVAAAPAAPFRTEAPEEAQVREIGAKLRCPVCQSENILDSQSGTAREMIAVLREQLALGRSEAEILGYFRSRYGDYVLLSPPASGFGGVIWLVPPLLLAAAGAVYILLVRRNAEAARRAGQASQPRAPLDEQSLRRLEL
ncbi:MAG: cytochrome c-type biogenesis protein CcmH [Hyphomicrobiales bacterium]|nr:MAG: cytochrome c-type biogenesis protein CcmH [Hyphomicrobiales bacterium]